MTAFNMSNPANPIIISGPSQVGKDAVVNQLLEKGAELNLVKAVTYTSREQRPEEVEGVDHHFVTAEKFQELIKQDFFLEWAPVREKYFGTPKQAVLDLISQGKNVILKIDVRGAKQVKEKFSQVITIFIMPDSLENLKTRMEKKGFSPEQMAIRWQEALNEIEEAKTYDYRVINQEGKLKQTVAEVIDILKKKE